MLVSLNLPVDDLGSGNPVPCLSSSSTTGDKKMSGTSAPEHGEDTMSDSDDIHERLSKPTKVQPLFGGTVSEKAARYNKPRHFGKAVLAVMKAYERDA